MKLYTEEQVIEMIEKSRQTGLTAEYLILTTTPLNCQVMKRYTMNPKLVAWIHVNNCVFNSVQNGCVIKYREVTNEG